MSFIIVREKQRKRDITRKNVQSFSDPEEGGRKIWTPFPLKNPKNIWLLTVSEALYNLSILKNNLRNNGTDPLKGHKATKLAFNVIIGTPAKRHVNVILSKL